ncbi:MAG: TetR/AcrR family transcriptional regulator [Hyphomicrobiales bacterium]|nr:TetR/AcrR family transcriptional regulator [Hyphomicrobiales bacterium]
MARRSDHNRGELHDIALSAARKIALTEGLKGLTARKVADEIGYSPGTLYNVFGDMDDLIIQLIAQTLDELYIYLASVRGEGNPIDDLKLILEKYIKYLEGHRNLWNILFEHQLPNDRSLPDWYTIKLAKLLGIIENALSPIFPSGQEDACANSARVLWASLHGLNSLSEAGKMRTVSAQSFQELAEILIVCFVKGLQQTQKEIDTTMPEVH